MNIFIIVAAVLSLAIMGMVASYIGSRLAERRALKEKPSLTDEEDDGLPPVTDEVRVIERSGDDVAYACGHTYPSSYAIDLYGRPQRFTDQFFKDRPFCGDCAVTEMTKDFARCASCGRDIAPGAPVALYLDDGTFDKKRKKVSFTHPDGRVSFAGCMRWSCCPSGGFFAGHWTGKEVRPLTPDGGGIVNMAFQTGKIVTGDTSGKIELHDMPERKNEPEP